MKETVCTKANQALAAVLQRTDAVCWATFTTRLCTITGSHFEREVQGPRADAPLPPRRCCGSTSGAEKSGSGRSFTQDRKEMALCRNSLQRSKWSACWGAAAASGHLQSQPVCDVAGRTAARQDQVCLKWPLVTIAVGTTVAGRPPHRPGRAQLRHPVLTSSDDGTTR